MSNLNKIIDEVLAKPGSGGVLEAVNRLLGEDIAPGTKVAIIDDDSSIGGYAGAKGTVLGTTANKGSGFVDVELEGGVVVPCQSSLLIPV